MNEIEKNQNLTFTTEPKMRRHLTRGAFTSRNRATEFMCHLWKVKLRKQCRYETLEFEFVNWSGTNDKRTVERYIGRPPQTVYSKGSAQTVRMNRNSGKIAQFDYSNIRRTERKAGLLEVLGYITLEQEEKEIIEASYQITKKTNEWIAVLHHERMSYYTRQASLEEANSVQEPDECFELSKDGLCACSLSEKGNNNQGFLQGKECEKTVLEVVSPTSIEATERIKKEEEVIDSTHTNQSSESEQEPTPRKTEELTPEALQLLRASREACK